MVWHRLIGLFVLSFLAWVCGKGRASTPLKTVYIGLGIQILTALALIKISVFKEFFVFLRNTAEIIVASTRIGTTFFGHLHNALDRSCGWSIDISYKRQLLIS